MISGLLTNAHDVWSNSFSLYVYTRDYDDNKLTLVVDNKLSIIGATASFNINGKERSVHPLELPGLDYGEYISRGIIYLRVNNSTIILNNDEWTYISYANVKI